MTNLKKYLLNAAVFLAAYSVGHYFSNPTDIHRNAVMIVTKAENSGGTGIIWKSTTEGSYVLTNKHVCNAIKNGGIVKSDTERYQVQSTLESEVSDLCLVYVPANLDQNTKVATSSPKRFSEEKVSGHPALMPTVITTGHFSGRQIISVMSGTRPCTDADKDNMFCTFFGIIPVIKSYDSQLVTSTIMPGSSGSGVYNKSNELSGVVFAGSGEFGYGWIVPHDQVAQFLQKEVYTGTWATLDQTLNQPATPEKSNVKDMVKKCVEATDPIIVQFCKILKRDVMYNE